MAMTTIRVEFTIDDYIVEDWCDDRRLNVDDFADHVMDFTDDYLGLTIDDAYIV